MLPHALAVVEMRQDALDHARIFDGGNDFHLPATGLDVDLEHALQPLCPRHRRVACSRWLIRGRLRAAHAGPFNLALRHLPTAKIRHCLAAKDPLANRR